ncbi:transcriptional regulator [Actinoplanes bogorensis]|uniref:Transcriptional regulator n=1 Tax=Paractinoplanes bogorensis TaxID=1610840 RepID=A0ABS5Z3H5_9ACTN|nr:BTAD domain-containing putative transcriptional regulator [Actinoplanes bogorensis]MBU2670223.1 transcriptional regulator [Actinoplanes bogorensis]
MTDERLPPIRDGAATMRVRVLHGFEFSERGSVLALPANVERVIALLAVRERPQHRNTVAATLWSDTTVDRAAASLRTALWQSRRIVGGCLAGAGAYLTVAAVVDVDVRRVGRQIQRLFDAGTTLDDADCNPRDLAGDLLPEWDEEWLVFERERLRQLRIHALEALCRKLSAAGRSGEAIDAGLAAVGAEPLRESAQRALIQAHLDEGNVSEARRQYHAYRELLLDSLEIEPSDGLRSLVLGGVARPHAS